MNPALEIIKTIASAATPIIVAVVGYYLNKRLKSIDDAQWQSRKIIEKRIEIYDQIAPDLNKVFCFCRFIGDWKSISPPDMLSTKRKLDKTVNIYRHLLSEDFYEKYNAFIGISFRTFAGHGKDALIRSAVRNSWGDRSHHASYSWEDRFNDMFDSSAPSSDEDLSATYLATMEALISCIGLQVRKPSAD